MIVWPTVKLREDEHPWVSYFKQQTLRKNNCINAVATGMPGTGKSWGMIYLLSKNDPTFNINRIFFKVSKMLRWVNDGEIKKKKGTSFMLDEAGIDVANTQWWNEINRGLNAFFQTNRSSNYCFGMTVPFLKLVSKGVRNLMNVRFHAAGHKNDHTKFKSGHALEYNDDLDKVYKKKLYVRKKEGGSFCTSLKLPKADGKLIEEYEKRKEVFKVTLVSDIVKKLEKHELKEKEKENISDIGVLTSTQQNYYNLRWSGKNQKEVCEILGISMRSGYDLAQRIKQRGKLFPKETEIKEKMALELKNSRNMSV